tara:strand:- start:338 stop:484 length:147 start_codon:yes stop_codon:yes gene_type:complete
MSNKLWRIIDRHNDTIKTQGKLITQLRAENEQLTIEINKLKNTDEQET